MSLQKSPAVKEADRLTDVLEVAPTLTSNDAAWDGISLETHCSPPGETPEFRFNHYAVGISLGQKLEVEHSLEGKIHRATYVQGSVAICPNQIPHSFRWNRPMQTLTLNLQPELLNHNAVHLFEKDWVELVPHFAIQDGLIQQIGLALQAELRSHSSRGRLYAEALANALAVHLLQHYATQSHPLKMQSGGVLQHRLRSVLDYINDQLEHELSLSDLAAIAQFSQHHFCYAFKQATGLSPHQYLIHQRVERAKQLLHRGEMTIGEVAIACGFSHQSHLNRHFKRLTGLTPNTWRNS